MVTLLSTAYDPAATTVTHEVQLLDVKLITDRTFGLEPLTALDAPREYAEASLFIDDGYILANDAEIVAILKNNHVEI